MSLIPSAKLLSELLTLRSPFFLPDLLFSGRIESAEFDVFSLGSLLTAAVFLIGPFLGSNIRWLSGIPYCLEKKKQ